MRKVKKIIPYTRKWEKMADDLARSWVTIDPCIDCGYPVVDGYVCHTCGSTSPRGA